MGHDNRNTEDRIMTYWYIFRQATGACVMRMKGAKPSEESMKQLGYFAVKTNVDLGRPKGLVFINDEVKRVVSI